MIQRPPTEQDRLELHHFIEDELHELVDGAMDVGWTFAEIEAELPRCLAEMAEEVVQEVRRP